MTRSQQHKEFRRAQRAALDEQIAERQIQRLAAAQGGMRFRTVSVAPPRTYSDSHKAAAVDGAGREGGAVRELGYRYDVRAHVVNASWAYYAPRVSTAGAAV